MPKARKPERRALPARLLTGTKQQRHDNPEIVPAHPVRQCSNTRSSFHHIHCFVIKQSDPARMMQDDLRKRRTAMPEDSDLDGSPANSTTIGIRPPLEAACRQCQGETVLTNALGIKALGRLASRRRHCWHWRHRRPG